MKLLGIIQPGKGNMPFSSVQKCFSLFKLRQFPKRSCQYLHAMPSPLFARYTRSSLHPDLFPESSAPLHRLPPKMCIRDRLPCEQNSVPAALFLPQQTQKRQTKQRKNHRKNHPLDDLIVICHVPAARVANGERNILKASARCCFFQKNMRCNRRCSAVKQHQHIDRLINSVPPKQ